MIHVEECKKEFFLIVCRTFIDPSRAAHLWVGSAKAVYPSLSGKNGVLLIFVKF